jgi:peptide/nickel transport system permease protein
MATEEITAGRIEAWEIDARRNPLARVFRGLLYFVRRKPLGTFGGVLLFIPVFFAIFGPSFDVGPVHWPGFLPYEYREYQIGQDTLRGPSGGHIMGTDHLGRDLFSRIVFGARLSLGIGFGVFAISTLLSTSLTLVCGYYVRTVDLILQRVIELISFLPDLILLVALFSIYGAKPLTLILTLGVLTGLTTVRVLRAVVIGIRALPYIEAAKSLGASDFRIITRHILPNVMYLIIIGSTQALAIFVTIEAGLAILGISVNPTYPTLGNLLNASRNYLRVAPYLAIFPGLVLFMILLGSRLLGDALRDVLDPRLRGSR